MLLIWSTVLASVGGIFLALLVLFKSKKIYANIFFSLMSIVLSLVVAANYLSLTNKDSSEATLFWIRVVMFLVPSLMLFLYYFAQSYLNNEFKIKLKNLILLGTITVVLSIINITSLTYSGVSISEAGDIIPKTGIGLILNGFYILPLFGLSIFIMIRNSKKAENPYDKNMIRFALFSFLVSFGIQIITSFVVVAMFHYTSLIPVGNFLTFLFVIIMTYLILYMKAFNVNFIGAFVFAIILSILMLAEIFTASGIQTIIYKIIVFLAVSLIGYEFIISVRREIKLREDLQVLTKQLQVANEQLKIMDAMKTEFVSMASHELLTPISAIEGYLSMIVDEHLVRIEDPKANKYIKSVYLSSKRLARLVADLLNVSRIEEGRLLVEKKVVNVVELMQQTVDELKFKAAEKQVKLSFVSRLDPNYINTFGDADKIKEVLVNLSGNGIKYNKAGGQVVLSAQLWPTQTVEQRWHTMAHTVIDKGRFGQGALQRIVNSAYTQMVGEQQIVIAIQDTGIGIAYEDIGKLFQKFSRVGDWSTQETPGTGLGLYVSKALIEMHHGKIWVESAGVGKGSTFFFSLPLASYQQNIKQMDSQVPAQKNMKGLARMGGGPVGKV